MMTQRNQPAGKAGKITYWISTLWLALGMLSTGIVQLIQMEDQVDGITRLGYPGYFLSILGVWKILGVIAVLVPSGRQILLDLLKEWAYAGFFFAMTGAIISHIISGSSMNDLFGPTLLLILTGISWYFRPMVRGEARVRA